ncbi:MAG: hypothetical protein H6782_04965 [Candidatus Nomurabacteria bacterium]|nr:MAG: hypothetical protein H6782_04965 [Candidatus Nomurabacteria bacterium]
MKLKTTLILKELEKLVKQGYLLHGTWHFTKQLSPRTFTKLRYFGLEQVGKTYREKVVYGTWDVLTAILHAVLGSPYRRNLWVQGSIKTKTGIMRLVTLWHRPQLRPGHILILPNKNFVPSRDRSVSMVSKVPVVVVQKIVVNPSILGALVSEHILRLEREYLNN